MQTALRPKMCRSTHELALYSVTKYTCGTKNVFDMQVYYVVILSRLTV
jgi:hypothetical protein